MKFFKYQANGNDFIILDNSCKKIQLSNQDIQKLCDRKFGIGADGLILLEMKQGFDYSMIYFNSDGKKSSFCGNGSRCLAHFAQKKEIFKNKASFFANQYSYEAIVDNNNISIKMNSVKGLIYNKDGSIFLDTGSPHLVFFRNSVQNLDIENLGRNIRNSVDYREKGVNVNFVEIHQNFLFVRTYERGVERETLSCGTGVVAAAIASHNKGILNEIENILIKTNGGNLYVNFHFENETYQDIYLSGNVSLVFQGDF